MFYKVFTFLWICFWSRALLNKSKRRASWSPGLFFAGPSYLFFPVFLPHQSAAEKLSHASDEVSPISFCLNSPRRKRRPSRFLQLLNPTHSVKGTWRSLWSEGIEYEEICGRGDGWVGGGRLLAVAFEAVVGHRAEASFLTECRRHSRMPCRSPQGWHWDCCYSQRAHVAFETSQQPSLMTIHTEGRSIPLPQDFKEDLFSYHF